MTDHEYIISRLDWFYDISDCIVNYFKKHTDADFEIARETWNITKAALQLFLKDHLCDIYMDDSLFTYYECLSRNFEFIDNNIVPNGGSYAETLNDNDTCNLSRPNYTNTTRNPSSSCNNTWHNFTCRIRDWFTINW